MLIKVSAKSKNSFRVTTPSAFESNISKLYSAASASPTEAMKSWQMSAWSSSKVIPPSPFSVLQIANPGTTKKFLVPPKNFSKWGLCNYLLNAVVSSPRKSKSSSCRPAFPPNATWNDKPRRANNSKVDFILEVNSKVTHRSQFLSLIYTYRNKCLQS